MPHPSRLLRRAVFDAIAAVQVAEGYIRNDFQLRESYVPQGDLVTIQDTPLVTVIALEGSEEIKSRGGLYTAEVPVQLALQAAVDPQDVAACDELLDLLEQIKGTLRTLSGWRWQRLSGLRDENGVPYDYARLRETHTLEAVITSYYFYAAS